MNELKFKMETSKGSEFTYKSKHHSNFNSVVILTGEMGSGKSNILQRYLNNLFSRVAPTIGSEFLTKKIVLSDLPDKPQLKALIWDTSGSERYRSITTGHYRQAVGALLVMDITERESFDNLDFWLG